LVGRFYGYASTRNDEKSYIDGKFKFIVHWPGPNATFL
jgi:hypothetical protein